MAINQLKQKSRLLAKFDTTGTFKVPANVDEVFVSIHSSTGGGQGATGNYGTRYAPNPGTEQPGAAAGEGRICSAIIQVTPGDSIAVTVGAFGTGGAGGGYVQGGGANAGSAGNAGGTSSFGSTQLVVTGSGGGGAGSATAAGTGVTSLGTVIPATSPVQLTGTIASQATGAQSAGAGGVTGSTTGANGQGAIVFVYC